MKAKYLMINLGDTDFNSYIDIVAKAVESMLDWTHFKPKDYEDLRCLKHAIANIWNGFYMMSTLARGEREQNKIAYFEEALWLDIVNFTDIPESGDRTAIYIPLFKCAETIIV